MGMKRIFVIIPILVVLLGISDIAFAKHHHHHKKEDNKDDNGRKVPCLVKGVQQMVKTEEVCKDFGGTVVADKTSPKAMTEANKKITVQKIQSNIGEKK